MWLWWRPWWWIGKGRFSSWLGRLWLFFKRRLLIDTFWIVQRKWLGGYLLELWSFGAFGWEFAINVDTFLRGCIAWSDLLELVFAWLCLFAELIIPILWNFIGGLVSVISVSWLVLFVALLFNPFYKDMKFEDTWSLFLVVKLDLQGKFIRACVAHILGYVYYWPFELYLLLVQVVLDFPWDFNLPIAMLTYFLRNLCVS